MTEIFIWVIGAIFTTGFITMFYKDEKHQVYIFMAAALWCALVWPYFLGRQIVKLGMIDKGSK